MTGELGYLIGGTQHPSALGCLQLDVNLYDGPTGRLFDPTQAAFPVANRLGEVKHKVVAHPWYLMKGFPVCVGRIILRDQLGDTIEAYSFGGELAIAEERSRTSCHLHSTAPILLLNDQHSLSTLFISIFESQLAREHATWVSDDTGFEARLTAIEPTTLFAAALAAVAAQLDQASARQRGTRYWQGAAIIHRAIQNMQEDGVWPTPTPTLDGLLARLH
jgi:hypothetical protein